MIGIHRSDSHPSPVRDRAEEMTVRVLLILVAMCISTSAFTQDAPPKVGSKLLTQMKPKEPMGCKLVGTVRGTKLWAGDCTSSDDLRGTTPAEETQPLSERAIGIIPPGPKQ
jgi:hypothetical protein